MDGDCEGNPDDFGPTVTFCCEDVDAGNGGSLPRGTIAKETSTIAW
jgi:hypothetical protein